MKILQSKNFYSAFLRVFCLEKESVLISPITILLFLKKKQKLKKKT